MFSSCPAEGEGCDSRVSSQLKEPDRAKAFGRVGHVEGFKQNPRAHSPYSLTVYIKASSGLYMLFYEQTWVIFPHEKHDKSISSTSNKNSTVFT